MICEDGFKGGVHGAAAMLFAVMAAYNLMRLMSVGGTRNAVNLALYGPMTIWEMRQAQYHWSQPRAVPLVDVTARMA